MGDCNGDNDVTVDDLVTMVNIAMVTQPIDACPLADVDGNGGVTVDEIVAGVGNALAGCAPAPSPQLERTAGATHSILVETMLMVSAVPFFGGPETAARALGTAASVMGCEGGGTVDVSCRVSGKSNILTLEYRNCRYPGDSTTWINLTGRVVVTVPKKGLCATGVIPPDVRTTTHLSDFRAEVVTTGGVIVERESFPDLTVVFDPAGSGCGGSNGTLTMNGTFDLEQPPYAIDMSGTVRNLALRLSSSGTPCVGVVEATGVVTFDDAATGQRVDASFEHTVFTIRAAGEHLAAISVTGPVVIGCVGGRVTLATEVPVLLAGGDCPQQGEIGVVLPDGSLAGWRYGTGGSLTCDDDGDHVYDRTMASCVDPAMSMCR